MLTLWTFEKLTVGLWASFEHRKVHFEEPETSLHLQCLHRDLFKVMRIFFSNIFLSESEKC